MWRLRLGHQRHRLVLPLLVLPVSVVSVLVISRRLVRESFNGFVTLLSVWRNVLSVITSRSVARVAVVAVAVRIVSRWLPDCRMLWSARRNEFFAKMTGVPVNVKPITVAAVARVTALPLSEIWLIVLSVLSVRRWVFRVNVIVTPMTVTGSVMTGFVRRQRTLPS